MKDPEIYVKYPDAMLPITQWNYIRDRMQSALMYTLECGQMEVMWSEGIYDESNLQQRLLAIFGRVDTI